MIDRDSMVGGASAFDNQIPLNRAVAQVAGSASALDVVHFCDLAKRSDTFRAKLRNVSMTLKHLVS
jgi:hypothetical protein